MAFSINTNIASLNAHRNLSKTQEGLAQSLARLSSGLRINKAADDASGLAIANALRATGLGIGQAVKNATDGISLIQIADGALEEVTNIINTIRTKAVQAASDSQTTETRRLIQNDIDRLLEQLDNIAKDTAFNGQKLLSGAFTNKALQIGAGANQTASISIASVESTKLGHVSSANLSLSSPEGGEVQLTITSSITGQKLTLNKVDVQSNNRAENGIGALADEINRYTSTTGIRATAVVQTTSGSAIQSGVTGADFAINGITIGAISVQANDANAALVNGINAKQEETGVVASITADGKLTLSSVDGRAIKVTGDVSGVMGSTANQMSTIGYLKLVQSGVSEFQISGIGAGATGANFTLTADVTTVQDSIMAAGSTIWAGSKLTAGSVVGGNARVLVAADPTQLATTLKAGSTITYNSQLVAGTILGGSMRVGGETTAGNIALTQDMLVAAGSVLKSGTVLGTGTVVSTTFTAGGVEYNAGQTLTSSVTLDSDLTLTADMTLKYNSTGGNSTIALDSTLNAGTQLGAKFTVGLRYDGGDNTAAATAFAADTATTVDRILDAAVTQAVGAGNTVTFKAGSLLKDGTSFAISAGGAWTGPTLVTTTGVITEGDTVAADTIVTLQGDQVLTEDLTTRANVTGGGVSIAAGSILLAGTIFNTTAGGGGTSDIVDAKENLLLANDMTVSSGSRLEAGTTMLAGSQLGSDTYVFGGDYGDASASLSTYTTTNLKAGSTLQGTGTAGDGTVLAAGSTVGGTVTVASSTGAQVTLTSDMTLKTGSTLKFVSGANNTLLKAGTVIGQDMTLNTANNGASATEVSVKAGDVLTTDLYLDADVTLSSDMTLKKDSVLAAGTQIATNTANAGTVGLSEKALNRMSDLNLLTAEGAQLAIDIADAALKDVDRVRSSLGSVQNQLTSTVASLSITQTNVQAAESGIRDVDFAAEAGNFSKLQILSQAGSFALAQANASAQAVLSLLQ